MAAKDVKFSTDARQRMLHGVDILANAVKVTLGPEGPQRRSRKELRCAPDHQGRRHRRQGNRALRQVREHGRADAARGRVEDLRRGRRRHDDGDRACPVDRPRRREGRRRGHEPDGPEARHRYRVRSHYQGSEGALEGRLDQCRNRPGRHHLGEWREGNRRHDRPRHGKGRQGRGDYLRGSEKPVE